MKVRVKICGITEFDGARAAMEAGVEAIGFVFARSPRQVTAVQAADISSRVGSEILKVAVFARPDAPEVEAVLADFRPDMVQADYQSRSAVPDSIRFLPVIHQGAPPRVMPDGCFLLDSANSGTGELTDWSQAADQAANRRLILAGGLNPGNVAEAIASVRPHGVDVSSGVERRRGMKDPELISSFVAAVRATEMEPAGP